MLNSFRHAIDGIQSAFSEHQNFRIHTIAGVLVIGAAIFLQVTRIDFIILLFTVTLVFIVEMINTSIEEITNLITIKWAKQAKIAKDVAAGMALLTAMSATVVGFLIFYPYLVKFIR